MAASRGVLLVDKSEGPTSHDVVASVRRAFGMRRVGHTGTLDPFASGLLLICVGDATRLVEYFHMLPKRYEAELRLGVETDTHDRCGRVVAGSEGWREVTPTALEESLNRFKGRISQRPPSFSARHASGQRAYELARAGEAVSLASRSVTVDCLELLEYRPPRARIVARVSTGTYIRALARDIGRHLECGAHLTALRRTAIGSFDVSAAISERSLSAGDAISDLEHSDAWLSPAEALAWLPSRSLTNPEVELVRTGRAIELGRLETGAGDIGPSEPVRSSEADTRPVRLLFAGDLVALAEPREGSLQPRKVFVA